MALGILMNKWKLDDYQSICRKTQVNISYTRNEPIDFDSLGWDWSVILYGKGCENEKNTKH